MNLNKKYIGWALVVLAILIAGYLGVSYPIPAPPATVSQSLGVIRFNQAVQFLMPETHSGTEAHSGIETHSGAATFSGATTLGGLSCSTAAITATGSISNAGNITTTGDITASNVTVSRNITATGSITAASVSVAGYISATGLITAANVSTSQNITATGNISAANVSTSRNVTVTGNISVAGVTNLGILYSAWPVLDKTDTYSLTAMQSGVMVVNVSASKDITIALPDAMANLFYCVGIGASYAITVDVSTDDFILGLTNAAHNRIANTGTVGDSVCLLAIDSTNWIPVGAARGTWSDKD